jgi:hypothetical protein
MLLRRTIIGLSLLLGCAPPQSVDRATLTDALEPLPRPTDARTATSDGSGSIDPRPPDARLDTARDTAIDRPQDRASERTPDSSPPPDASRTDDGGGDGGGGEAGAGLTALMIVGNPNMLSASDTRVRTLLEMRNLAVTLGDDNAMPPDLAGFSLIVLSGSCASATLANKYRDAARPLLNLEPAVQDDMGMTPGTDADLGEQEMSSGLSITMANHPMAAGLTGNIGVVSMASSFGWGRPAAAAQRVATLQGMAQRVAVFAYAKGAMMANLVAPARRVGFFASDDSARYLGPNGVALFNAALTWLLTPDSMMP